MRWIRKHWEEWRLWGIYVCELKSPSREMLDSKAAEAFMRGWTEGQEWLRRKNLEEDK